MITIKADYKELLSVEDKLKIESENLDKEIEELLKVLTEVRSAWEGADSDIFTGKAEAYFKNIKQISGSINEFGSFIKYAENNYETRDIRWKKEIEEAGANFGDEELKHKDQE